MDQRDPRDGRTIEEIGLFHPLEDGEKQITLNQERVKYWLSVGAVPSDTVRGILNQRQICVK
jgi:small subunit ribosomal protein S16